MSLDDVVRVGRFTPRSVALSVVRGKVAAIHDVHLEAYNRLYRISGRMRKREILLELELARSLLWQAIKLEQELLQELERARGW